MTEDKIIQTLSEMLQGKIDSNRAVGALLLECTGESLADFIVDAVNRGWISYFNLGLDDEGKII